MRLKTTVMKRLAKKIGKKCVDIKVYMTKSGQIKAITRVIK